MPGFVLLELLQGCKNRKAQKRVLDLAAQCRVVWLSEEAFGRAVDLFVQHRLRHGLDMIDALVGQTALELGTPIVTFNVKHYSCIEGLELVSPYQRT
jgi:predicted nucleic acid-binding protein